MTNQLFDTRPEWQKKQSGMATASINHGLCLETARKLAISLLSEKDVISIDEVRDALVAKGYDLSGRIKWLGSVFLAPEFVHAGFKQAEHANSHSRIIRTWKLR